MTIGSSLYKLSYMEKIEEILKRRLKTVIDIGILTKSKIIEMDSFIVGQEYDSNGEMINPRVQFYVCKGPKKLVELLVNRKVGDTITYNESGLEILEIYKIKS